jgi:hypothetical protein
MPFSTPSQTDPYELSIIQCGRVLIGCSVLLTFTEQRSIRAYSAFTMHERLLNVEPMRGNWKLDWHKR